MRKHNTLSSTNTEQPRATAVSSDMYKELFENSPCCCFTLDQNGFIQLINKAARRSLGFSCEYAGDVRLAECLADDSGKAFIEMYEQIKLSGDGAALKILLERSEQPALSVCLKVTPTFDEAGTFQGSQGAFFDDTQHPESKVGNDSDAIAQKIKHEVLMGISHDIRTPLNAIIGMGDLLAATDLSPQQQTYLNYLRTASARLFGFIKEAIR